MPAIQLARLKKQLSDLRQAWSDPDIFLRQLIELLEYYADHSFRTGQAAEPSPLLKSFQVPPPLIRQIKHALDDLAIADPGYTLQICDTLWASPIYETRLLAVHFLGLIPVRAGEIASRAGRWLAVTTDQQLIDAMFTHGLNRFAAQNPDTYLQLVEAWLGSNSRLEKALGLRAMATLVRQPEFKNFPPCFRLLAPFVHQANQDLRPELVESLRALAERSPKEAAYFFIEMLESGYNTQMGMLLRLALEPLPPDLQATVRSHLRESRRSVG
jgi:hypothetical protein